MKCLVSLFATNGRLEPLDGCIPRRQTDKIKTCKAERRTEALQDFAILEFLCRDILLSSWSMCLPGLFIEQVHQCLFVCLFVFYLLWIFPSQSFIILVSERLMGFVSILLCRNETEHDQRIN